MKTQYTGDAESFAPVVAVALGRPVVIAGGPRVRLGEALYNAHGAVAAGVCFGRNTYNRTDVEGFVRMLVAVVRNGRSPEEVLTTPQLARLATL